MKHSNKADERPSLQWYVDDWLSDGGLKRCDLRARGLWMDLLCWMFKEPTRGCLKAESEAQLKQDIVRLVGRPAPEVEAALNQLVKYKVCESDGAGRIYSRRMVRDESKRQAKINAGQKGGLASGQSRRQAELKQGASTSSRPRARPASSSSPISTSKRKSTAPSPSTLERLRTAGCGEDENMPLATIAGLIELYRAGYDRSIKDEDLPIWVERLRGTRIRGERLAAAFYGFSGGWNRERGLPRLEDFARFVNDNRVAYC